MLVLKNGILIDAKREQKADILLKDGKIQAIGRDLEADQQVDISGKVALPAFIESHAHFRYPGQSYKEDLYTGSLAALKGGYSTVNLMANTQPVVDQPQVYQNIIDEAKRVNLIHIYQNYAVSKGLAGQEWVDFDQMPDSVKFISDDGYGLHKNKDTYQLFERLSDLKLPIMIHEEDKDLSEIDYRLAEDVHTMRDVYFAGKTGARVHFCHVSTEDSARAIQIGKSLGYPVTMEVTPHHIYLTDSDYKVHPPIRTERDRRYLVEAIIDGSVDCIATDHAPHSQEDKDNGAPGMIGLETAFQITYKTLVEEFGQDLKLVSKMLSYGPAKLLGLKKGLLEIGLDADLVVIDLNRRETIRPENIRSKSKNTPFIGESFTGVIEKTIVQGDIRYQEGDK